MKRPVIMILFVIMCLYARATGSWPSLMELPPFERACLIIKYYEAMHHPEHWPTIGYGHVVQPGEPYRKGIQLTEQQADTLLRQDLRKFCAMYRSYGADSLLLACLSFNCGPARILGGKGKGKSRLLRKIESGSRDILPEYLAFCHFKGKTHKRLRQRRFVEYMALFVK